jgi:hypothetical protein
MPAYMWLLRVGNDVISWFNRLNDGQKNTILVTLGVVAVIGPLLVIFGTLISSIGSIVTGIGVLGTALKALWIVMATNPILLVIGALAALVVGLGIYNASNTPATNSTSGLAGQMERLKNANTAVNQAEQTLTDARLARTGANLAVERAQLNYNSAVEQFGPNSLEAREAEYQLASARQYSKTKTQEAEAAERSRNKKLSLQADANVAVEKERKIGEAVNGATTKIQNQINQFGILNNNLNAMNGKNFSYTVTGNSKGTKVPGNASGTNYWKGGPTWVGERGPEILNLPRGSQIIPNDKAKATSTTTANFTGNIYLGDSGAVDNFFARLSRNSELASKGMATLT